MESTPAPTDRDHDGISDQWEKANGLNSNDTSDRNKVAEDGYTTLEKYINSLVTNDYKSFVFASCHLPKVSGEAI